MRYMNTVKLLSAHEREIQISLKFKNNVVVAEWLRRSVKANPNELEILTSTGIFDVNI